MNELLAQIIFAAQSRDAEGWMNILFVVVLAVVWVIGGIVKARASKAKEGDEGRLPGRPARKPPESGRGVQQFQKEPRRPTVAASGRQQLAEVQKPRTKVTQPQPVSQKVAAKKKAPVQFAAVERLEGPKLGEVISELQPEFQELPEFTSKAVKALEDKRIRAPAEIPEAKYLSEILLDYAEPEELKTAILHYEILGRPLSLRGPSERIIGL